ncbi:hypothetical protein AN958_09960 [Leucoagaricus sp. SymC.cos]|nr:hypothetical protein AN958_09960 [Leucoagaricus sp. SymC.cos]
MPNSPPRRSEEYNFRGGDLHLSVEQILFRIHSYHFWRGSEYWKRELLGPKAAPGAETLDVPILQGNSDSDPIFIEDVEPADFELLLKVFYNDEYGDFSEFGIADWIMILHLAARWEFAKVKDLAVRHLEKVDMDLIKRIKLYLENKVPDRYLFRHYVQLARREELLGLEDAHALGIETLEDAALGIETFEDAQALRIKIKTFVLIQQARERLRGQASSDAPSRVRTGTQRVDIARIVASTFNLSLEDLGVV